MTRATDVRPLIFGEVLWDCFPDGRQVLGGAPFNVAWNLQALGGAPLLVSRVGADERGERVRARMDHWGLDRAGLELDPDLPTGRVDVSLAAGEPVYTIAADAAWDRIDAAKLDWSGGLLYHGSLALRAPGSRAALARLRERSADVFVDVNLRAPHWDAATVRGLLAGARWAKLNADELALLAPAGVEPGRRAESLRAAAGLEALIVTRGAAGAEVHRAEAPPLARPAPAAARVVDTVGAGDAFSAAAIHGLRQGWGWPLILDRAQALARSVVGLRGATTDDREFYRTRIERWE